LLIWVAGVDLTTNSLVVIVAICISVFTFVFASCRAATSRSRPPQLFVALPAVEACALCGRVDLFHRKSTR